jgi:hypothetical protein
MGNRMEAPGLWPTFVVLRAANNSLVYEGTDEDEAALSCSAGTVCGMDEEPVEAMNKARAAAQLVRARGRTEKTV